IKFELIKIFPHQLNGIKATKKSPHFPRPLILVFKIGLNCNVRFLTTLTIIQKYKAHTKVNQNHHHSCHCDKCTKMSDL
ncbi:MAG: hypothetical protein KDH96_08875, partial [Candidatus Riesia sp.]|nr:hypothetical protein [Candidatus Riesia sp.]